MDIAVIMVQHLLQFLYLAAGVWFAAFLGIFLMLSSNLYCLNVAYKMCDKIQSTAVN
jgi:hypothetical protein